MTDALDVSGFQRDIDGAAIAASGVGLVIVKLTEGGYRSNDYAPQQVASVRAAGLRLGGYHFARPGNPEAEADTYLAAADALALGGADVIHALDLEPYPGVGWPLDQAATLDYTARWCDRVAANVAGAVWWYSYPSFIDQLLPRDERIDRYGCWIADPTAAVQGFPPRTGGRDHVLWQIGQGETAGVNGNCDLNVYGPAYDRPAPPPSRSSDVIRQVVTADGQGIPGIAAEGSLWIYSTSRWEAVAAAAPGVAVQPIDSVAFTTLRDEQEAFRKLLAGGAATGGDGTPVDVDAVVQAALGALATTQPGEASAVASAIRGALT